MLEQLTIKDFALIDSLSLELSDGFTVLSGETGAGKSILIGALSFVLGGKADVEQIRTGANEAVVTASFVLNLPAAAGQKKTGGSTDNEEPRSAWDWLAVHGIEPEDGRILLRRLVRNNGKTGAWIQGSPVTRSDLVSFSAFLIDIHGQHEHQSLMRVAEHRVFLDAWAGITENVNSFTALYAELVQKRRLLDQINSSENDRSRRIDILTFAVNEITQAKLTAGEDEELGAEESKLSSFEKLYSVIKDITEAFDNDTSGIVPLLKKARNTVSQAVSLDKSLGALDSRIESSFYEISDIAEEFRTYSNNLVFDPERLAVVQDRMALIYSLKKKYASSTASPVGDVIAYCSAAQKELENLTGGAVEKNALKELCESLERSVYVAAKEISVKRRTAAEKMEKGVEDVLARLGMAGTRFSVDIKDKPGTGVEQKCGPYGMDDIEFLISANKGAPLLPLAKIASGGELSRVMLALKTIFAETDSVPTMIFDEIDTGIGGEVAVAVGSHMKTLAKKRQILCITHLASIAVYADNQIKVEKGIEENVMRTVASEVKGEKRVAEIARMLSGDSESEESLDHARSMLLKFSGKLSD